MTNPDQLANRLQEVARKADQLQQQVKQLPDDGDDTLWLSSLDIIDQLLNAITGLVQSEEAGQVTATIQVALPCPECHKATDSHADVCPYCGNDFRRGQSDHP
ncbi:MAG: hypothetical protein ACOX2K_01450 [Bacillota bacterium]|jgi:hypothetical protein